MASRRARSFWAGAIAGAGASLALTTVVAIAVATGIAWWQSLPGSSEASALLRLVVLGTLVGATVSALGGAIGWATCQRDPAERQGVSA
jgi:hypothetical protein